MVKGTQLKQKDKELEYSIGDSSPEEKQPNPLDFYSNGAEKKPSSPTESENGDEPEKKAEKPKKIKINPEDILMEYSERLM